MEKRAPSIKKVSYAFRGAFEYTTTAGALQEARNTVWDLIHVALGPKNLTAMIESLEFTSLETHVYENILSMQRPEIAHAGDQGDLQHPASNFTMKNLEELKLESMTNMASLPLMIVQLRNLTKLSLKGSKGLFGAANSSRTGGTIEPGTERMFWMIRSLPRLEQLNLDGCGIKEFPLLDSLPVNSSLKRLSMNDNPEMVFKKGLAAFQALEWVSMKSCNMPCVSSA
eukprot:jgi/Picre1/32906/NNA_008235.t1